MAKVIIFQRENVLTGNITRIFHIFKFRNKTRQAGTELGQAQLKLKLELSFT